MSTNETTTDLVFTQKPYFMQLTIEANTDAGYAWLDKQAMQPGAIELNFPIRLLKRLEQDAKDAGLTIKHKASLRN